MFKMRLMKGFMFFINLLYWISLFLVPVVLLGGIGLWLFIQSNENLIFSIFMLFFSIVAGVLFAEYIRKKYGLDNFFGRTLATPDIEGGTHLDENTSSNQEIKIERDGDNNEKI